MKGRRRSGNRSGNGPYGIEKHGRGNGFLHIGECQAHGRQLFTSRKLARAAIRGFQGERGARMAAYRCDATEGMWHIGHLPGAVKRGEAGREDIGRST